MKKLNIGCGDHPLAGWTNCDTAPMRGADVKYMDATKPWPYPDATFDRVFSEHMIEHVPYLGGAIMIREAFRVLVPGGRIRISTPNLKFLMDMVTEPLTNLQMDYIEWATKLFCPFQPAMPEVVLNNFVRAWGHQFIYSEGLLGGLLKEYGFIDIVSCKVGISEDPEFALAENTSRMPDGFLQLETMTLEASKPCA